jgi:peroxiredoxin
MQRFLRSSCLILASMMVSLAYGEEQSPQTLSEQLADTAKKSSTRLTPEMLQAMQQAVEEVRATGIEKSAKQVGDAAIDAKLKGWNGETVQLSELWNDGPIVLMWYRGGWCPYCNLQLQAMQKTLKAIEGTGAKLVVLTPELPEKAKETAAANDVEFVALHDEGNATARKYGLVFKLAESIIPVYRDRLKLAEYNGNDTMELPLSATYVIDRGGRITYAFLDADYKKRAEPADVVAAVRKLAVRKLAGPPRVGDAAPEFQLQTPDGRVVKLSDTLKHGPAVVVVLRGYPGYQCPICTRQVGSLISSGKDFAAKDATVILVYPGPAKGLAAKAQEFVKGSQLPDNFEFVIDPGYAVTKSYSLRWNAPQETAYPSTFVVGKDGTIDFAVVSKSHGGRADTASVLKALGSEVAE